MNLKTLNIKYTSKLTVRGSGTEINHPNTEIIKIYTYILNDVPVPTISKLMRSKES